ncbi:GvpL/GvpF family gas vesicle protein [Yoonia sp. F2084L]|uniref:GvpL/GvpF family gas vesicle protein n=1 Tax=Yoonia sp. F2084L TaxID=2926419 RepID=UPI001FF6E763|nr:GvpL/GvpF family gas vesicle protein [Yoonia sp. F2084L]MCK0094097.1 GvpL/GvpF family gas vesicle protein [Yoonia sp. F2084L]
MGLMQLHGLLPKFAQAQSGGPAHRLLTCGPVTALISSFPSLKKFENLTSDEVAAWAMHHHAVLLAYCANTPVLPMAVGAVFSSDAAIKREVMAEIDKHCQSLRALAQVKEYTVQLTLTEPPPITASEPKGGRAFLQARRHQRDTRQQLHVSQRRMAHDILERLKTDALQVTSAGNAKPDKLLNCAILVDIERVTNLQRMARTLDGPAKENGLDLVVAGPWPPYSFNPDAATTQEVHDATGA